MIATLTNHTTVDTTDLVALRAAADAGLVPLNPPYPVPGRCSACKQPTLRRHPKYGRGCAS